MPTDDFESFEWDEAKSERTREERGFDFEFAAHIFAGDYLADEDRVRTTASRGTSRSARWRASSC